MKSLLTLSILLAGLAPASASEIALTFDDAPRKDERIFTGDQRTAKLIEVLGRHAIQAAFFANSKSMTRYNGKTRLGAYSQAGHIIANHTHAHSDIKKISTDQYIQDLRMRTGCWVSLRPSRSGFGFHFFARVKLSKFVIKSGSI